MKTITLTQHELQQQTKTMVYKSKKLYTRKIKHKNKKDKNYE